MLRAAGISPRGPGYRFWRPEQPSQFCPRDYPATPWQEWFRPAHKIRSPGAWHLRPRVSRPIPLMAGRREFGPDDEKNFSHVTLCLRFIYRDFSSSGRPVARISRPRGGRSVSVPGGPDQAPHHLNSLEVAWTKVMMGCVGAGIVEAPQFSMA